MTSFSNVILSKHYERDKTTEKEASKKKRKFSSRTTGSYCVCKIKKNINEKEEGKKRYGKKEWWKPINNTKKQMMLISDEKVIVYKIARDDGNKMEKI